MPFLTYFSPKLITIANLRSSRINALQQTGAAQGAMDLNGTIHDVFADLVFCHGSSLGFDVVVNNNAKVQRKAFYPFSNP
jgi:hypothetical protein